MKLAIKAPSTNIIRRVIEQKSNLTDSTSEKKKCIYKLSELNISMSTNDKFTIMSKYAAISMLGK